MGPLFVLIFWAIFATVSSIVGGLALAGLVALRYTWPDLIPLTIFAVPALGVAIVLVYALIRRRATRNKTVTA